MNSTRKRSAKALEVSNPIVMGRSEVNLTGRAFEPSSRANCGSGENLVGDVQGHHDVGAGVSACQVSMCES